MGPETVPILLAAIAVAFGAGLAATRLRAARRTASDAREIAGLSSRLEAAEAARRAAEARAEELAAELAGARRDARIREGELEAARDSISAALASLSVPVWRRSAGLRIVDCNPAFAAAVEASVADAIAEGRMLGGPQVALRTRELAAAAASERAPRSVELHVVVGGARRRLEISEAPLPGGGTVGTAIDVTAREDLRAEMKRVVAAHADVLENLQTAIAVFGADQRLRFFNTAYARLWRLDEAWLRGEPDFGSVLEELRAQRRLPEYADFREFKRQRLKLFTSLIEPLEEVAYIPDGTTLHARIAPHPLGGLLFTYEDVTDRLALERSYNTLIAVQRETIDNLLEGVAVIGSDARVKLWNPAFLGLWGLSAEDLAGDVHIGRLVDLTRALHRAGPDWEAERERLVARLTDRVPRRERETRADGKVLEFSSVPLPDGAVLISYVDVTDTTRVEEALRERAAAFEAADRLKSEFISSVSYELRTPLNGIIGFTEVLANQYFGELNERQLDYCRDIISASHRLLTIINDILDLASIEAGRLVLEREPVEAYAALEGTIQVMADLARGADLALRIGSCEAMPPLDADARRLKQALCNLVSNAIKFSPPGGEILLSATQGPDGMAALTVTDRGRGIPKEDQDRVFRAFERVRRPDGPDHGAGLGLSLVRRIVEMHGGRVSIDSRVGQGTTVACLVPLAKDQAP
ncbi:MAG: PAS domain-containing protein [Alphaproteobacteria bacterium]|nr:PAS domain-containing protein [Alphaproteobacteria bacterium]